MEGRYFFRTLDQDPDARTAERSKSTCGNLFSGHAFFISWEMRGRGNKDPVPFLQKSEKTGGFLETRRSIRALSTVRLCLQGKFTAVSGNRERTGPGRDGKEETLCWQVSYGKAACLMRRKFTG